MKKGEKEASVFGKIAFQNRCEISFMQFPLYIFFAILILYIKTKGRGKKLERTLALISYMNEMPKHFICLAMLNLFL